MQERNKYATKDKSMEKTLEVAEACGKGWMFAVWMKREEQMGEIFGNHTAHQSSAAHLRAGSRGQLTTVPSWV